MAIPAIRLVENFVSCGCMLSVLRPAVSYSTISTTLLACHISLMAGETIYVYNTHNYLLIDKILPH